MYNNGIAVKLCVDSNRKKGECALLATMERDEGMRKTNRGSCRNTKLEKSRHSENLLSRCDKFYVVLPGSKRPKTVYHFEGWSLVHLVWNLKHRWFQRTRVTFENKSFGSAGFTV